MKVSSGTSLFLYDFRELTKAAPLPMCLPAPAHNKKKKIYLRRTFKLLDNCWEKLKPELSFDGANANIINLNEPIEMRHALFSSAFGKNVEKSVCRTDENEKILFLKGNIS